MNTEERRALWLLAEVVEFKGGRYKRVPEFQANCQGCVFQHCNCDEFRGIWYTCLSESEPACDRVIWAEAE